MSEDAARSDDPTPEYRRRHPLARLTPFARAVLLWSAIGVLLLAALGSTIGIAQREIYSPRGLVGAYLDALARHDTQAALALPGVAMTRGDLAAAGLPANASRELLRSDVLASLGDVRMVHDDELPDGTHQVTADVTVGGRSESMNFTLEHAGSTLGVFQNWRFAVSPLAVAEVSVLHTDTFDLAGHTVDVNATTKATTTFTQKADYLVFAPGSYRLSHHSRDLSARAVTATVTKASQVTDVEVDAEPTPALTRQVEDRLNHYLDDCVTQKVLQPTGCPMGIEIDDRVQGTPAWSMVSYPTISLIAGPDSWLVPAASGVAHITVTVQSLFDGTVAKRDEDVDFEVALSRVVIEPSGSIDITVQ